ncbi:MAG TPA: tetratricopeptide repeat protein [Anaerolineales bacterium]|nr:tetratricopeptide repeat protein [Anaerolineales bacterium]
MNASNPIESERRLSAIMFTDMVGYSALTQRNEALAMKLLEKQRSIVQGALAKHKGREVDSIGDGFMVEFASALDAVNCAVEIQSALKEANVTRADEKKIWLRIGIHLGDVIHIGKRVMGDAVNVASRIEPLAPAGGVCVTAQVHASVLNKFEGTFESMGVPELKNISTPMEVYRIAGYGGPVDRIVPSMASLPKDRIAILPLANISADQSDDYFADGLTEELISSVSRTKGLRVIARTSVMRCKDTKMSIAEIGRELNVGSVLEGSIRKSGNKIRISVQFVDTSSEEPQWSQDYDREIQDVLEIQSDIARKVAEALREHVLGGVQRSQKGRATRNPDAYINYLRGRQLWNQRTEKSMKQAIDFFNNALKIDENYAMAYTGLADCYTTLAFLEFMAPHEAHPKARQAAEKALSLNGRLAEAHTSLGWIKFMYDWDWEGAEKEFKKAISINPSYASAHHFYADYLKAMGRFDEALTEIEKAQELDPLSLAISTGVGHVLYLSRQYDEAIEQYQRAVDLDPDFMITHVWFGRPYLEKGMYEEAISELEIAVKLSGESTLPLAMLGHGLASAGRKDEALEILEKLKERSESEYVPSYWIAVIYNGFRDKEKVITWMKKAYEERSSWLVWTNVEPRFDWLRNDPDVAELLKAMKFP